MTKKIDNFNADEFYMHYVYNYTYLRENEDCYDYSLIDDGDRFIHDYPEVVKAFAEKSHDIISSDREAGAFALTFYDLGLVDIPEHHYWKSKMRIDRETKKTEAIKRMKMWGIFPETIKQFEQGLLSESLPPVGACFWLDDEAMKRVYEFEAENNALVYFVIHSYTNIGELENYLFVGDYPEEWELDIEDIKEGQQLVWCYNHDMPDCSEFGSIGIQRTVAAGLQRTW